MKRGAVLVDVAIETDELAGISSGLEKGDKVVLQNPDALKDEQELSSDEFKVQPW